MLTLPHIRYSWLLIAALLLAVLIIATLWLTIIGPMHSHTLHMLFADDGTNIVIRNH